LTQYGKRKEKNPSLNDEEIRLLLETSTNEEAQKLLKRLQKSSANVSDFDEKIKEIFTLAPTGKLRAIKLVDKFFLEYNSARAKVFPCILRDKTFV
jgi:superfamily I DNA and/or RNA helicase